MGYVGVPPQSGFITTAKQRVTGSTNNYVDLDHSISSLADVIVWVNSVKQDSTNLTLTTSTRITLGGTLVSSDVCEIFFLGKAVATQTPDTGTVTNDMLAGSIANSKLATPTTINNNADNRVITGSGTANTLEGEANLTFDGTQLILTDSNEGTDNLLVKTTSDNSISMALEKSDFKFDLGLDHNNDGSQNFYIRERHQGGSNTNAVRLMINDQGELLLGVTSPITGEGILQVKGIGNQNVSAFQVGGDGQVAIRFFNSSGSGVGGINANTSSTTYNTSSDYRLKENEIAISDGIARLKQLKPYKFNFKTEPDKTVDGFFAHEVSSVVPEATTGEKDAVDENGDIKAQGIDQSKLVPLLTSALQEAITKIETLEARVKTLEDA